MFNDAEKYGPQATLDGAKQVHDDYFNAQEQLQQQNPGRMQIQVAPGDFQGYFSPFVLYFVVLHTL